jgi:hypothetical protein
MTLFSIAGGAPPGGEAWSLCCFFFPVLPLVVFLSARAVSRTSFPAAFLAMLLVGLPFLLVAWGVAGYEPSDDSDVLAEQETGRQVLVCYACLLALAALPMAYVAVRLYLQRRSKTKEQDESAMFEGGAVEPTAGPDVSSSFALKLVCLALLWLAMVLLARRVG